MEQRNKNNVMVIASNPVDLLAFLKKTLFHDEIRFEYSDKHIDKAEEYFPLLKKLGFDETDRGSEVKKLPNREKPGEYYTLHSNFIILEKAGFLKRLYIDKEEEIKQQVKNEKGEDDRTT